MYHSIQSLRLLMELHTLQAWQTSILWKAMSHAVINAQKLFVQVYQPLFIARYSFIWLIDLESERPYRKFKTGSTVFKQ